MNILDGIHQGSLEWMAARANRFCASEAAAAMGVSKYMTRTDLLKLKKTGIADEVGSAKQRLFDAGHASEANARPIAEMILGEDLYPVTGIAETDGLSLLASFDGITLMEDAIWENKLRNEGLIAQIRNDDLEPHYWAQLEHQLIVSGASKALFTTSDGTESGTYYLWYKSQPERRTAVLAAWKQFAEDLKTFVPPAEAPQAPMAALIESLPALTVTVEGRVVASNLAGFKNAASAFLAKIKTELKTDQDFADADKTVKFCKDGEDRLELVKEQALSQTASIDELFRTIDAISDEMRQKRLSLEKLVKARKESIRTEIATEGQSALNEHVAKLNDRLGAVWIQRIVGGFGEAIKGKKTVASLRDAVSVELANQKIATSALADRLEANRKALHFDDRDWFFLFADFASVGAKPAEDFSAIMAQRVQKHKDELKAVEDAKTAAALTVATAKSTTSNTSPAPAFSANETVVSRSIISAQSSVSPTRSKQSYSMIEVLQVVKKDAAFLRLNIATQLAVDSAIAAATV